MPPTLAPQLARPSREEILAQLRENFGHRRFRLPMMRGYAEAAGCRREYIMNSRAAVYDPGDCRLCDNSRAAALALVRERNLIEWCDAV